MKYFDRCGVSFMINENKKIHGGGVISFYFEAMNNKSLCSFNNAVSISDCTAWNDKMISEY
jgi:hypothetical protein